MDEEMITLQNIMPVELAIRRELEYRRKTEALRKHNQSDLKPLVISQGLPSSRIGIKREVPASKSEGSPIDQQLSSTCLVYQKELGFACKACDLTFAGVFHLSSHFESQAHKGKVNQMKKRKEAISNPIWCELCNSSSSSFNDLERHVTGSKHTSLLVKFEKAEQTKLERR